MRKIACASATNEIRQSLDVNVTMTFHKTM